MDLTNYMPCIENGKDIMIFLGCFFSTVALGFVLI